MTLKSFALAIGLIGLSPTAAYAAQFGTEVPMREKESVTYYVTAHFNGDEGAEFMVDTGSGYMTISETTLALLEKQGRATYVKDLTGIMADGSRKTVSVYRISSINIGCCCVVRDVEAAVFPGTKRQILGLSALKKVAPFAVSMQPPSLLLSNCEV